MSHIAEAPSGIAQSYSLEVVEMSQSHLIIDVQLEDYDIAAEGSGDALVYRIEASGMSVLLPPGSLELPSISKLIGVPQGGVKRITVLEVESEVIDGVRLATVPHVDTGSRANSLVAAYMAGSNAIGSNISYAEPVTIGMVGKLREQHVAQLLLHPFDYAPEQSQLTVRRRIRAELQFEAPAGSSDGMAQASSARDTQPAALHEAAYADIYRSTLLNYPALPQQKVTQGELTQEERLVDVQPATAKVAAQGERLKIIIDEAGIYRVSYAWIKGTGFNVDDVDPALLQLHHLDQEVAMYINGAEDGQIDINDWISFYGKASDSPFDTQNVYWLSVGSSPGQRIQTSDGSVDEAVDPTEWFRRAKSWEMNNVYWKDMPLSPDGPSFVGQPESQNSAAAHETTQPEQPRQESFWFWERYPSAPAAQDYSFWLSNVIQLGASAAGSHGGLAASSSSSQALKGLITVHLHGRTDTPESPDHHTKVFLNDTEIADFWWDGQVRHTEQITVLQSLFQEGENRLTVSMPGDTGAAVDSIYFDSFDVVYWAEKVAFENSLEFSGRSGSQAYGIINFNKPGIEVYNVSEPNNPIQIVNGYEWFGNGSYRIKFADVQEEAANYVALQVSEKRTPVDLALVSQPVWRDPQRQADYLIITHPDFKSALAPLATFRQASGLSVELVDIFDLYDEFSHGIRSPQAIRNFLEYAYHNWQRPAPLYVLLVGDANYDYKGYLSGDYPNFVPTALFNSEVIGQTPTDNWFVSVSGDDFLPDMFVGRISASTDTEVAAAVEKTVAYEAASNPTGADDGTPGWIKQSLFVAEDEANFQDVSDRLIEQMPYTYSASRIYGSEFVNPSDATPRILESIDQGVSLITYIGHGSITGWFWDERLLESTDISTLNNEFQYPFLITGSCNNGLFAHPDQRVAFAEEFVNTPKRGGIGVWSPTGLGYTYWHDKLIEALYEQFFDEYQVELGPATTAAKVKAFGELGWREPVEISTLFGDPALGLRISKPEVDLVVKPITVEAISGEPFQYAITVKNNGTDTINNVEIVSEISNGQFKWSIPTGAGVPVQWVVDELAPGAARIIIVTIAVTEQSSPDQAVTISTKLVQSNQTLETDIQTLPVALPIEPSPTPPLPPVGEGTNVPDATPAPGTPTPSTPEVPLPGATVTPNPTTQTPNQPPIQSTPTPTEQALPATLLYMPLR